MLYVLTGAMNDVFIYVKSLATKVGDSIVTRQLQTYIIFIQYLRIKINVIASIYLISVKFIAIDWRVRNSPTAIWPSRCVSLIRRRRTRFLIVSQNPINRFPSSFLMHFSICKYAKLDKPLAQLSQSVWLILMQKHSDAGTRSPTALVNVTDNF